MSTRPAWAAESFRALLQLVYTRPDRARIRGASLLVLGGGLDYFIRPSAIRRTAEAYGAECTILPGVAHDMMLDAGWRQAAEAMLEWLQRTLEPDARAAACSVGALRLEDAARVADAHRLDLVLADAEAAQGGDHDVRDGEEVRLRQRAVEDLARASGLSGSASVLCSPGSAR